MQKAGGVIAIIAGVISILAAVITLLFGGIGGALEAEGAETVIGLGWGGLFIAFLVIVTGAIAMNSETKKPGIFLIILSILGIIFGGTIVAIFMILSLIGGVVALIGTNKSKRKAAG